jgi:hypothetical protein
MTRRLALLTALALLAWGVWTIGVFAAGKAYSRAEWRHWLDVPDHPCRSVRQAVLARDARPGSVVWDEGGCRVVSGQWISPYSGELIETPAVLDVDHVVSLQEAWTWGGHRWDAKRRERYANCWAPCFRFQLLPVEASLNRSKGAQGIADGWLPPSDLHQCSYVMIRATIIVLNDLHPPAAERAAMAKVAAETC